MVTCYFLPQSFISLRHCSSCKYESERRDTMAKCPVFCFRSISSYTQCFPVVDCPDMQNFLPQYHHNICQEGYIWKLYCSKAVILPGVFSNCHSRKAQTYPLSQTTHSTCDYIYHGKVVNVDRWG